MSAQGVSPADEGLRGGEPGRSLSSKHRIHGCEGHAESPTRARLTCREDAPLVNGCLGIGDELHGWGRQARSLGSRDGGMGFIIDSSMPPPCPDCIERGEIGAALFERGEALLKLALHVPTWLVG